MRFLLWSALSLFVIFILLIAGLVLYLTPAKIESLAEKTVSAQLGQELSFTNAHFNILNGFVFQDIVLSPASDSSGAAVIIPVHSATAKEISLRYSLAGILKRRLLITSAVIDSPQVRLVMTAAADTSRKSTAPDSIGAIESFISLNLVKFRLRDATITVDVVDSLRRQHIYLDDISIFVDDVALPHGDVMAQDSLLQGRFQLDCQKSQCRYEQLTPEPQVHFAAILDAHVEMMVSGLADIGVSGSIALNDIAVDMNDAFSFRPAFDTPVLAELKGHLDARSGAAHFDPIALTIDTAPWLSLVVQADSLFRAPHLNATVVDSRIPVQQLIALARPFIVDSIPSIYLHNPGAHISLAGTRVFGVLPDSTNGQSLTCIARIALQNFGVTLNRNEHFLRNFNFTSEFSALLGYNAILNPAARVAVSYDSVFITTADKQKVFSGRSHINIDADLDADLLPTLVDAQLAITNVLGADIHSDINLHRSGTIDTFSGTGVVSFQGFDISPFTKSQIRSRVSAHAELTLNSLQDITTTLTVNTDTVIVQQEFDELAVRPLALTSTFRAATDTLFQHVTLRSLTASLNDFMTAELAGAAAVTPQSIIDLNRLSLSIDHAALLNWLPRQLKEPLADLAVTGTSTVTSNIHLNMNDTTYQAGLHMRTHDLSLDYQDGLAALSGISLDIKCSIDSHERASAGLSLDIDNIQSSEFTRANFRDNKIVLKLSMPDFQTVEIDTGLLSLPDLKTTGIIGGRVHFVDNSPVINSHIRLAQNAADTIHLMQDTFYHGKNEIAVSIRSNSTVAHLSAGINMSDLTVSLPNNIRVDRINSRVVIAQNIDMQNGKLLMSPQAIVRTPSDGLVDYHLYRDYYQQDEKRPSEIHIRRAVVGDYLVENIQVEAYIGAGTIEIPAFALDVYGGNIGGAFSLISDQDNLLESSYKLSVHMSGINSALLLPSLQSRSQGILTAHSELQGKGFDIIHGIDLAGYFHITNIESKVANNLLTSLDPEGKDSAIKFTKLVMNYGYKPSLLTFDIGNGYCYPAVHFSQPWYNPVRLSGGSIEFARIPIASFFTVEK
ncbi:hypothetical protein JW998_15980 [candidate division KSB1 bacterium]|nr:hypothetical protein [candidate division KSB1 bacterium]